MRWRARRLGWRRALQTVVLLPLLAGCAAQAEPSATGATSPAESPRQQRTLVVAIRVEPNTLTHKALQAAGNLTFDATRGLFNANLVTIDGSGVPRPQLAEALPVLRTDSWRLAADGSMETTFRLRPDLTWHDGAPLTADDYAFAWQVYASPELGVASAPPQSIIDDVQTPDDQTLIIHWRQPYADAGILATSFPALPRHLLGDAFESRGATGESFVAQPFWTSAYVGLGAFRLTHWEPGTAIDAEAFPDYVFGRPKIDRLRLVFVNDPNTVVANLLSGAAQLTFDDAIRFEQGAVLNREWADGSRGSVLHYPQQVRYTEVQLKPDLVQPPALRDVRVRRALAHAVDKQSLVDTLLEGVGMTADTIVSPRVEYFGALNRSITRYSYDVRAAEQLMNEAGFTRRSDGYFADGSGDRLALELRVRASSHNESEMSIMAAGWNSAGLATSSYVIPAAQALDSVVLATFPSLSTTSRPAQEGQLVNLTTGLIPSAENRWSGTNRGGWSNAEYDRLADAFNATLDREERNRQAIEMMRIVSQDLPGIFLYYNEQIVAQAASLRGPAPIAPASLLTWDAHTWELR